MPSYRRDVRPCEFPRRDAIILRVSMNPFDFAGRTPIVTGGMQGIGAAIAQRLQASRAKVAIWDLDGKPRVDVADQTPTHPPLQITIPELRKIHLLTNNTANPHPN